MANELRQDQETGASATKTDLPNPGFAWFIAHPSNGGHYDDGTECADWPVMIPDPKTDTGDPA